MHSHSYTICTLGSAGWHALTQLPHNMHTLGSAGWHALTQLHNMHTRLSRVTCTHTAIHNIHTRPSHFGEFSKLYSEAIAKNSYSSKILLLHIYVCLFTFKYHQNTNICCFTSTHKWGTSSHTYIIYIKNYRYPQKVLNVTNILVLHVKH